MNRIKNILKEKGMTQKELAKQIGITEAALNRGINGNPSKDLSSRIAKALNTPEDELYSKEGLHALYEGELTIGDKVIPCAVLNDGTRVLTASSVFEAFDRPRKGKALDRVDQMPAFLDAKNLQQFVDEELIGWTKLIPDKSLNRQSLQGYNARILRAICKVYIDARKSGQLVKSQERFAQISESILYALSDTGIIALVDEATGYDKVKTRAKDELQKFFAKALQDNAGKWVKTFPDEFFESIYRMRQWTWTGTSKRPSVIGRWIIDIVYDRIAPDLLTELQKRNPSVNGNRKYKHHQFLTDGFGHPKLQQHIEGVLAIARISGNNWARFMHNLDVAYPKQYSTIEIFGDEYFED